jgi:hypothetical protein
VLTLDVAPGVVNAVVQGSRAQPYQVRIELARFPEPLWGRLEEALAGQAFFSARLLAGDLPAELEDLFAASGAPLFPAGVGELRQHCSCPDVAVPCKHLAASFYLLAEAFDADPFRLLHWRGRERGDLLDRLRTLRGGARPAPPSGPAGSDTARSGPAGSAPARSDGTRPDATRLDATRPDATGSGAGSGPGGTPGTGVPVAGAARVLADLPAVPVADLLDRFWLSPVPLPDRPPTLATGPELLLRQLGPPGGALGGPGLTERLRRAYQRFGAADGPPDDRWTAGGDPDPSP